MHTKLAELFSFSGMESWMGTSTTGSGITLNLQLWHKGNSFVGTAFLLQGDNSQSFSASGEGSRIVLFSEGKHTYTINGFEGKEGVGVLTGSADEENMPIEFRQIMEDNAIPPLSSNHIDSGDVPYPVTYDVKLDDGKGFHLGNFSITPILLPMGTWQGTTLWGVNNGLCTVVLNPLFLRVEITLTTWNPLSHVGYLKFSRLEADYGKTMNLLDSWIYPADNWVSAQGKITQGKKKR